MAMFTASRLLTALAIAAFSLPAAAQVTPPATDSQAATVSSTGLDLAKPEDQATLRHRVAVAAHKICSQITQGDPLTSPGYEDCFSRATAEARAQVDTQIAIANSRAMVASVTR